MAAVRSSWAPLHLKAAASVAAAAAASAEEPAAAGGSGAGRPASRTAAGDGVGRGRRCWCPGDAAGVAARQEAEAVPPRVAIMVGEELTPQRDKRRTVFFRMKREGEKSKGDEGERATRPCLQSSVLARCSPLAVSRPHTWRPLSPHPPFWPAWKPGTRRGGRGRHGKRRGERALRRRWERAQKRSPECEARAQRPPPPPTRKRARR